MGELDDERLAAVVRSGDEAAFEALYDRHHAPLLAFCRHMLGSREDGEDALQQTFVRAHRALRAGRLPDAVRPWLFAIARNRCRTLLAARRDAALPIDDVEPGFDGLAEDVQRRAELRELVIDLGRLPDDQREALVLFELGDLSHAEIAAAIGCPAGKVKALVFQARTALIAERDARGTPCEEIRGQLEVARGAVLRRGPLRRHLRQCEPCRAYGVAFTSQRANLAWVLPVAPTAGLKAAVLGGAGVSGGAGTLAAAAAVGEAVSLGTAASGGGAVTAGGLAVKGLVAKLAVTVALGAGVSGAIASVDDAGVRHPESGRGAQTAQRASSPAPRPAPRRGDRAQISRGAQRARAVPARRSVRAASIRRRGRTPRTHRVAVRRVRRAQRVPRRVRSVARVARRLRSAERVPRPAVRAERKRLRTDVASPRRRRRARREAVVPPAAHGHPNRRTARGPRPGRRLTRQDLLMPRKRPR